MNPESFLSNFRGSYHVARLEWNYYITNMALSHSEIINLLFNTSGLIQQESRCKLIVRIPLPRLIRIKELQQNVAPFLLLEWAVVLTA